MTVQGMNFGTACVGRAFHSRLMCFMLQALQYHRDQIQRSLSRSMMSHS
jgi:hypothetical protein